MGALRGFVSLLGRVCLATIFLTSAAGNKIPNFAKVADYMQAAGVPFPKAALVCAIIFLLMGSVSLVLGYKARWGAFLLLVFLILATYFFHNFWTIQDQAAKDAQMIQFMKNLALMGAMLMVLANGAGAWSLDECCKKTAPPEA